MGRGGDDLHPREVGKIEKHIRGLRATEVCHVERDDSLLAAEHAALEEAYRGDKAGMERKHGDVEGN